MKRTHKSFQIAITLVSGLLIALSEPGFANNPNANIRDARQGLPGRRISGGSRSPETACLLNGDNSGENRKVVALAPESNLSRTAMAHPTFWFALPAVNTDRSIEFSLTTQDEEVIYSQTFKPTGKAGLTAISLPKTAPELSEDQTYQWHLSVVCDRSSRATDLLVWGYIERTSLQPSQRQRTTRVEGQGPVNLYEQLAAWNDALTALFDLHRDRVLNNQPTADLESKWTALLASENLGQQIAISKTMSLTSRPVELIGLETPLEDSR